MLELLDWKSWFTAAVIVVMIAALIRGVARPHYIFLTALAVLLISGIITPFQALGGFANNAVLTVGALFVVAAGVHQTRLFSYLEGYLLPGKRSTGRTIFRIMSSASAMSSFLNNTPIVAMFIPQLEQWAKKIGIPVSKLLIPLSYAAIVGGTITLIGTSTNLIVSEMLSDRGYAGFHLFQLAWIGLPATVLVVAWFALIGHRFLPDRTPKGGATVRDAAALENFGDSNLQEADSLTPGGEYEPVNGLAPQSFVDQRVYQGNFAFAAPFGGNNWPSGVYSTRFFVQNAIEASLLQNASKKTNTPPGAITVPDPIFSNGGTNGSSAAGTGNVPPDAHGDDKDPGHNEPPAGKSLRTLLILVLMIGAMATGVLPIYITVILAAAAMVVTGTLHYKKVLSSINFPVLIVIASALGVGAALESTGLAEVIALNVVGHTSGYGIVAVLIGIYLLTNLLTELVTNNAAAVLMIPVALSASVSLGIDVQAVAITVAVAASASFLSPIGYQTNLMIMDPGGYRFTDYFKAGFPVTIILMTITVGMVNWLWI